MPYILKGDGRREALQNGDSIAKTAGELNYQLFYLVKHSEILYEPLCEYEVKKRVQGFLGETPNYQKYNDAVGALVCCVMEIERRLGMDVSEIFLNVMYSFKSQLDAYEDTKIQLNGDVE